MTYHVRKKWSNIGHKCPKKCPNKCPKNVRFGHEFACSIGHYAQIEHYAHVEHYARFEHILKLNIMFNSKICLNKECISNTNFKFHKRICDLFFF